MKEKTKKQILQNSIFQLLLITLSLLIIPLIGTQLFSDWNWDLTDYIVMTVLIFSTGLGYKLTVAKVKKLNYKIIIALVFAFIFILIWGELAVGLFGTPFAGN